MSTDVEIDLLIPAQGPPGLPGPQGDMGDTGAAGVNGASYGGFSNTANTIGLGSLSYTTQSGLAYQPGSPIKAVSASNASNWVAGIVQSYSVNTLVIAVQRFNGSGSVSDWKFSITGDVQNVAGGGAVAIAYVFSTTTADADPGNGNLRLDNATQNAATVIRADLLDALGADWTSVLATLADSTSVVKGHLRLVKTSDPTEFLVFRLTSLASPTGYRNISVVNVGGSAASPFANGDAITLIFSRTGDAGTVSAGSVTAAALASSAIAQAVGMVNGTIVESHAANAATYAIKTLAGADPSAGDPVYFVVRDVNPALGDYVVRAVTAALSLTVPSAQALGTANNVPFRVWLGVIDNAGAVELAVQNCLIGGATPTAVTPLSESVLQSTTAIAAAPSAGVLYSTTARASKAFRIIAWVEYASGLATAGTWNASPTTIHLLGPGGRKPGDLVQRVFNITGAVASGSTAIPLDDTIPQNIEGFQVMSQAITPTSAANLLEIEAKADFAQDDAGGAIVTGALFQDSVANALSAAKAYNGAASNFDGIMQLKHFMQSATVAQMTFKLRLGASTAVSVTFNGRATGLRRFGGVMNSYMAVREIMA